MKILTVHNRYRYAGGEDNVFEAETALLRQNGHTIETWTVDNKNMDLNLIGKVKTAMTAAYSHKSKSLALNKLQLFRPDIVHVHNFFPQISPSVYDACNEEKIPVIQTLHNYRLICPGALLMRDGAICELCVKGSPYQAALYKCYRKSRIGSLAVANMVAHHRSRQTWQKKVARFIALTEFAKSKFIEAGFPEHKMVVKPNFVAQPHIKTEPPSKEASPYALFVGRLSSEKGIRTLANAWQNLSSRFRLKVAGEGELVSMLKNCSNVECLGFQSSTAVAALMQNASFLIMPSEWYEGFPMVMVEAFANGLPIISSKLGSMSEIVIEGQTGLFFKPGNSEDLAEKIDWLINNPAKRKQMAGNAKKTYLEKYTPEENLRQLLSVYQQAIK